MNCARNIVDLQSALHRHSHFVNGFACSLRDDGTGKNSSVILRDDLDKSIEVIVTDGAIHTAQIPSGNRYLVTKLGPSLLLGHSYVRNLWIRKCDSRDNLGKT